ncbi:unnamed protein product, partial [Mesorhabditis belari]|uniref:Protein kinase domain-containing protein n=1 Tax=Mesorhabditis belari TaxID=2138241 RepID=A0AAF3EQY5_9BILA
MEETWIGRGAFAHVVKIGKYPPHLAAKYIRIVYGNCREFYEREFKVLQKLRHPNIVNYYGMCETRKDHDSYYVIHMEFCERLSLRHVLKDAEVIYSMKTILGWAEHLTSALLYLKNSQIIHRDIKPENILVTNDFVLKLGDFGFVKEINGNQYSMSVAGTDRYVSPESSGFIREITATYKSDLYSVGLVLWEIVERRKIFEEYEDEKFKAFALFEDLRMGAFRLKFSYCDDEFKEVILRCTNFNPEMRPEVEQVHAQVVQMNESSPMESFLPIIEPNQKHPLKPVPLQRNNQEIQSFHSENTELSITIPNISMSPSKSQSHDEMIIELTLENERTEIPLKITLKEAISNLKMLAIRGDKKLLKAIENQIKKCTRFPDDYIICIDEMPKFPPIIDQKLIRFFQLRKYPNWGNLFPNVKKSRIPTSITKVYPIMKL